MAIEYPDVIGEYITAPKRAELNGLQFAGTFEPDKIKAWETTSLVLFLQNVMDGPLEVEIKVNLPQSGFFRGQPVLVTKETEIMLNMDRAEVGRLVIPMTTADKVVPGKHSVEVEFRVQHDKNVQRVRKQKQTSLLKTPLLDDLVGLDLVGVLGTNYSTQNAKKTSFELTVSKEPAEGEEKSDLKYSYNKIWTVELAENQRQARADVNEARVTILDDLKIEPVFVTLYSESQERFADAGCPLRIGEALALGKLLTYTVHFFLGQGPLQDGLLVPIWERALVNKFPTADTLNVIRHVGYRHIVRLAAALSFGLVAETTGKHLWPQEDRQALPSFIADSLEDGSTLMPDFLYLPLMMGGVKIAGKVRLPDENQRQTLQLIQKARQARPEVFADDEMAMADKVYDQLLNQALSQMKK